MRILPEARHGNAHTHTQRTDAGWAALVPDRNRTSGTPSGSGDAMMVARHVKGEGAAEGTLAVDANRKNALDDRCRSAMSIG